ncbi:hypothetical protein [Nonomuraea sp. NPDC048826]|uniref:hypothetical protein n=1 Tax=Nonomuraea sp. NPDC048826 TaxID=3364347 RepID=UPI00371E7660
MSGKLVPWRPAAGALFFTGVVLGWPHEEPLTLQSWPPCSARGSLSRRPWPGGAGRESRGSRRRPVRLLA